MESMWEYSIYFGMIREYSFDGTQYPFSDEIEHEESDVEPYKTLDTLVSESRKKSCKRDNKYFFYNRCMECQKDLNKLLAEHPEISNKSIDTQYHMGLPVYQHVFNFVKIDGKFFIIDPTYIQFCDMNCTEDVLGVPGAAGANPGMYLMEDGKKREFLHGLIRNGYFEATEKNIKMYFDSFVLANRNSNFYKNHASASTMGTEILAQDYIKAIVEGKKLFFGKPEEIGAIQHTDKSKVISE